MLDGLDLPTDQMCFTYSWCTSNLNTLFVPENKQRIDHKRYLTSDDSKPSGFTLFHVIVSLKITQGGKYLTYFGELFKCSC